MTQLGCVGGKEVGDIGGVAKVEPSFRSKENLKEKKTPHQIISAAMTKTWGARSGNGERVSLNSRPRKPGPSLDMAAWQLHMLLTRARREGRPRPQHQPCLLPWRPHCDLSQTLNWILPLASHQWGLRPVPAEAHMAPVSSCQKSPNPIIPPPRPPSCSPLLR